MSFIKYLYLFLLFSIVTLLHAKSFELTLAEREYLLEKKKITVCVIPDIYPIEGLVDHKHIGFTGDIFERFQKELPVLFDVIPSKSNLQTYENALNKRCDIKSISLEKFAPFPDIIFSKPLLHEFFVLITTVDKPFIENINIYKDKKYLVTFKAYQNYLTEKLGFTNVHYLPTKDEAIQELLENNAFAYVDISIIGGNVVSGYGFERLKINTKIDNTTLKGSIGIFDSNPHLKNIINKLIETIPPKELQTIKSKWMLEQNRFIIDYELVWKIIAFFSLILMVIFIFFMRQIRLKRDLQRYQERMELAFSGTSDGLWDWDIATGKVYYSPRWKSMLGYRENELDNSFETWEERVHPEDLSSVMEHVQKCLRGETEKFENSHRLRHKNGSWVWVLDRGQTTYYQGKAVRMIGTHTNITKEKQLEKKLLKSNRNLERMVKKRTQEQSRLLSLFDKGSSVLFQWSDTYHWNVEHVSQSISKLLGYTKESFLSQEIIYQERIHPNDLNRFMREIDEAHRRGDDYFEHEPYRLKHQDESYKWVYDSTLIARNDKGEIISVIAYIIDITPIKQKDQQLIEQSKLAQMGDLISMIAHQWRQPLSAISTTTMNMKMKTLLPHDQLTHEAFIEYINDRIERIDTYVQTLTQIITNFRNFYKPSTETTTCTIDKPLDNALAILDPSISSENITVELIRQSQKNIVMYQSELMQVLINIVQNALENFTQKGIDKPLITIHTYDEQNNVLVEISDNGKGIAENVLEHMFEPYFSTKKEKNGTGLGLYMSKKIIEDHHHGSLNVHNIQQGARVRIVLPAEN